MIRLLIYYLSICLADMSGWHCTDTARTVELTGISNLDAQAFFNFSDHFHFTPLSVAI